MGKAKALCASLNRISNFHYGESDQYANIVIHIQYTSFFLYNYVFYPFKKSAGKGNCINIKKILNRLDHRIICKCI